MNCDAALFGHWGSLLQCDLPMGHEEYHYDKILKVSWSKRE